MSESHYKTTEMQVILKLRTLQKSLPPFVTELFRGLSDYTSARTRLGYAYDLKTFFTYLSEEVCHKDIKSFTLEDLANITVDDIEGFMDYLTYYLKQKKEETSTSEVIVKNEAMGKSRKLAAIRTMFKYFYGKRKLPANPAELVGFPKVREKVITTLESNEIALLLELVESGDKLTDQQKQYHQHTKVRDVALITLLLGTGLRVSECIGLNLQDINFETEVLKITRKGGDEALLYFGQEVSEALQAYFILRKEMKPKVGHEDAFFLSMQNRRITDRAVQKMVKKYAELVTTLKKISPHKLRSTFGTQLYKETQDIYLVANILGHADVNTTRKHYAKMDDEHRRRAANAVKLRKD
ncbi:MAG: tyrosine-type recombinase/integrase [Defluviitaleaceae bacterium]|nr:tyrosine-type recombinase/integrase [Defluviitaleaceae bacterium]